jgi:hypothetical protein
MVGKVEKRRRCASLSLVYPTRPADNGAQIAWPERSGAAGQWSSRLERHSEQHPEESRSPGSVRVSASADVARRMNKMDTIPRDGS